MGDHDAGWFRDWKLVSTGAMADQDVNGRKIAWEWDEQRQHNGRLQFNQRRSRNDGNPDGHGQSRGYVQPVPANLR
jgi:hypothetical protein